MTGVLLFGYESRNAAKTTEAPADSARDAAASASAKKDSADQAGSASAAAAPALEAGTVLEVASPLEGKAVALSEVPDPIFAAGKLGEGVAVEPTGTTVVAPQRVKSQLLTPPVTQWASSWITAWNFWCTSVWIP